MRTDNQLNHLDPAKASQPRLTLQNATTCYNSNKVQFRRPAPNRPSPAPAQNEPMPHHPAQRPAPTHPTIELLGPS